MSLTIILIAILFALAFGVFVVGTVLHELRMVRFEKAYMLHPFARRWRRRPSIAISAESTLSDNEIKTIRQHSYHKIKSSSEHPSSTDLILRIPRNTQLDPAALRQTVQLLHSGEAIDSVEFAPVLLPATSVRDLVHQYYLMAIAPFIESRAGLKISLPSSPWPLLARPVTTRISLRTKVYIAVRWVMQLLHLIVFSYALYMAALLYQPEFLLLYVATLSVWVTWTIFSYPKLSLIRRIGYVILLPVSFFYFAYRLFSAPFRVRLLARAIARPQQNAMMEV